MTTRNHAVSVLIICTLICFPFSCKWTPSTTISPNLKTFFSLLTLRMVFHLGYHCIVCDNQQTRTVMSSLGPNDSTGGGVNLILMLFPSCKATVIRYLTVQSCNQSPCSFCIGYPHTSFTGSTPQPSYNMSSANLKIFFIDSTIIRTHIWTQNVGEASLRFWPLL